MPTVYQSIKAHTQEDTYLALNTRIRKRITRKQITAETNNEMILIDENLFGYFMWHRKRLGKYFEDDKEFVRYVMSKIDICKRIGSRYGIDDIERELRDRDSVSDQILFPSCEFAYLYDEEERVRAVATNVPKDMMNQCAVEKEETMNPHAMSSVTREEVNLCEAEKNWNVEDESPFRVTNNDSVNQKQLFEKVGVTKEELTEQITTQFVGLAAVEEVEAINHIPCGRATGVAAIVMILSVCLILWGLYFEYAYGLHEGEYDFVMSEEEMSVASYFDDVKYLDAYLDRYLLDAHASWLWYHKFVGVEPLDPALFVGVEPLDSERHTYPYLLDAHASWLWYHKFVGVEPLDPALFVGVEPLDPARHMYLYLMDADISTKYRQNWLYLMDAVGTEYGRIGPYLMDADIAVGCTSYGLYSNARGGEYGFNAEAVRDLDSDALSEGYKLFVEKERSGLNGIYCDAISGGEYKLYLEDLLLGVVPHYHASNDGQNRSGSNELCVEHLLKNKIASAVRIRQALSKQEYIGNFAFEFAYQVVFDPGGIINIRASQNDDIWQKEASLYCSSYSLTVYRDFGHQRQAENKEEIACIESRIYDQLNISGNFSKFVKSDATLNVNEFRSDAIIVHNSQIEQEQKRLKYERIWSTAPSSIKTYDLLDETLPIMTQNIATFDDVIGGIIYTIITVSNDDVVRERRLTNPEQEMNEAPVTLVQPQSIVVTSNTAQDNVCTGTTWLPRDASSLYDEEEYYTFPTSSGTSNIKMYDLLDETLPIMTQNIATFDDVMGGIIYTLREDKNMIYEGYVDKNANTGVTVTRDSNMHELSMSDNQSDVLSSRIAGNSMSYMDLFGTKYNEMISNELFDISDNGEWCPVSGHYRIGNYSDMMGNEPFYTREEAQRTIIGIKIEAVGRYHLYDELDTHLREKMDDESVQFENLMVLDDSQYLVMFLEDSPRITDVDPRKSIEIFRCACAGIHKVTYESIMKCDVNEKQEALVYLEMVTALAPPRYIIDEYNRVKNSTTTSTEDSNITVDAERFRGVEVMFKLSLIGKESAGIHKVAYERIIKCDVDEKQKALNDIVNQFDAELSVKSDVIGMNTQYCEYTFDTDHRHDGNNMCIIDHVMPNDTKNIDDAKHKTNLDYEAHHRLDMKALIMCDDAFKTEKKQDGIEKVSDPKYVEGLLDTTEKHKDSHEFRKELAQTFQSARQNDVAKLDQVNGIAAHTNEAEDDPFELWMFAVQPQARTMKLNHDAIQGNDGVILCRFSSDVTKDVNPNTHQTFQSVRNVMKLDQNNGIVSHPNTRNIYIVGGSYLDALDVDIFDPFSASITQNKLNFIHYLGGYDTERFVQNERIQCAFLPGLNPNIDLHAAECVQINQDEDDICWAFDIDLILDHMFVTAICSADRWSDIGLDSNAIFSTHELAVFKDDMVVEQRLGNPLPNMSSSEAPGTVLQPQSIVVTSNTSQDNVRTMTMWVLRDVIGLLYTFLKSSGQSIRLFMMARGHNAQIETDDFEVYNPLRNIHHRFDGYSKSNGFLFEAATTQESTHIHTPSLITSTRAQCDEGELDIIFLVDNSCNVDYDECMLRQVAISELIQFVDFVVELLIDDQEAIVYEYANIRKVDLRQSIPTTLQHLLINNCEDAHIHDACKDNMPFEVNGYCVKITMINMSVGDEEVKENDSNYEEKTESEEYNWNESDGSHQDVFVDDLACFSDLRYDPRANAAHGKQDQEQDLFDESSRADSISHNTFKIFNIGGVDEQTNDSCELNQLAMKASNKTRLGSIIWSINIDKLVKDLNLGIDHEIIEMILIIVFIKYYMIENLCAVNRSSMKASNTENDINSVTSISTLNVNVTDINALKVVIETDAKTAIKNIIELEYEDVRSEIIEMIRIIVICLNIAMW
eukprot:528476_1